MLDLLRGIIALAEERPMDVRLQRLAEEARGAGWRPIETAPRDGTDVDLWMVNEEGLGWREADARFVTDREDEFSDYSTGSHRTLRIRRDGWFAPNHDYDGDSGFCDQPVRQYGKPLRDTFITPTHWMPLPEPPQLPEIPIYAMDAHKPEGEA